MRERRGSLRKRRGTTSTAAAAIASIIVILLLVRAASSPKGAEEVFWAEFGLVKWIAGLLKVGEYLKEFEEYLKYVQGTELWPLTASILSMVCMIFSVLGAFLGTKAVVGTTTKILAWIRGRREKEPVAVEEDEKLWRRKHGREREEWCGIQNHLGGEKI